MNTKVVKTLDNFFSDWHNVIVRYDTHERFFAADWCREHFGIQGLKWDYWGVAITKEETKNGHLPVFRSFRFKRKEDALMFLLKFGG